MASVALQSLTSGMPTWLGLFVHEASKRATIAWWSDNGDAGARELAGEYGSFHYPSSGVPTLRIVPFVYENEYGGLTLTRGQNAADRNHLCAGSRDLLRQDEDVAWGGYWSAPGKWNGRFNDTSAAGVEECEIFPFGMIPPLNQPRCTTGEDLGTTAGGPWMGSDAFYYSVLFENERGEFSTYYRPLAPHSQWSGYPGFGFHQVDSGNTDHYFANVRFDNIPVAPRGWRRHIVRSTKLDTTNGTAFFPPSGLLYFCATIEDSEATEYVLSEGNDLTLDTSPIPAQLVARCWPPRARVSGRFDGRFLLGDLRPNPYALIVAPWRDAAQNLQIDDPDLYSSGVHAICVTPDSIWVKTEPEFASREVRILGRSLRDVAAELFIPYSESRVSHLFWYGTVRPVLSQDFSDGVDYNIGDEIAPECTDFWPGTKIVSIVLREAPNDGLDITLNKVPRSTLNKNESGYGSVIFITKTAVSSDIGGPTEWQAQPVPGADAEADADNLLRTLVTNVCSFTEGSTTVVMQETTTERNNGVRTIPACVTPGMGIYLDGAFAEGCVVTAVDEDSGVVTASSAALRDSVSGDLVLFAYDTGDTAEAGTPGWIRAFGNCWPAVLPWKKSYMDRFKDSRQSLIFTGANPGHAQNALESWYGTNRRTGPAAFGPLMAFADLGPTALVFFEKGRMRLWNPRTGLTHADEDYNLTTNSWTRGCCSPYFAVHGSGWAISCDRMGIYVCGEGIGEKSLTSYWDGDREVCTIYDPSAAEGERGELEYAITQSLIAAASGTDDYKIAAEVHGGVLRVRYWLNSDSTGFDREIRYDFSANTGESGPSSVLLPNGRPFPWSAPLTLNLLCSAEVVTADGPRIFAAVDDAAATSGRVDMVDVGTTDAGTAIAPMGYSGLRWPPALNKTAVYRLRALIRKAGTGVGIGVASATDRPPDESDYADQAIPTSEDRDYVRYIRPFEGRDRLPREAVGVRFYDDGSGPCPEIMLAELDIDDVEDVRTEGKK